MRLRDKLLHLDPSLHYVSLSKDAGPACSAANDAAPTWLRLQARGRIARNVGLAAAINEGSRQAT